MASHHHLDWPGKNDDYPGPIVPNVRNLPEDFDYHGEIRYQLEEGHAVVAYALLNKYEGPDKADLLYFAFQKSHQKGLLLEHNCHYGIGPSKAMRLWARQIGALPPDHPRSPFQTNMETHEYFWGNSLLENLEFYKYAWEHDLPLKWLHEDLNFPKRVRLEVEAFSLVRGVGPLEGDFYSRFLHHAALLSRSEKYK